MPLATSAHCKVFLRGKCCPEHASAACTVVRERRDKTRRSVSALIQKTHGGEWRQHAGIVTRPCTARRRSRCKEKGALPSFPMAGCFPSRCPRGHAHQARTHPLGAILRRKESLMTAFRTEFVHAPRPLPPARITCGNANALKKECHSVATTGERHACPSLHPASGDHRQDEAPSEVAQ